MRKTKPVACLLLLGHALCLNAAEHWIRLTTPHFQMYTTNGEKSAKSALAVFEQVRYFFLQNSRSKHVPDTPVEIIAFRSEKEFKPYRFNEGGFAYYLRSRKVDYIVMQDINAEHYEAAVHEYTHLFIEHLDLKLPIWLNEGLADLYSSLEPEGNRAVIGRPLAGREMVLRTQSWLDVSTLFAVGPESPYYNESNKMSIFYAQSWALTHMLVLGKNYMPAFPKFMAMVSSGRPISECFQSIYGKTFAQVTQDLQAYVQQRTVQAEVFDVKLTKPDLEPEVSEASPLSVDLTLANLLASQKRTLTEASERLSKLAAEHPENSEVQESLGYLAWDQGDTAKARGCFKLAVEQGSRNTQMLMQYAGLLHESGASVDQILPLLQVVVEIKPDNADAWFNIGIIATTAGRYREALDAFSHLKSVSPEQAYDLFSAKAFCYFKMKSPDQARANAEQARQYAKTPDERQRASNLLRLLGAGDEAAKDTVSDTALIGPSTGRPSIMRSRSDDLPRDVPSVMRRGQIKHVEAVTKFLDCQTKNRQLHVTVDSKELIFEFDDPDHVTVRNAPGAAIDFQCGEQKPVNLGIFYVPTVPPASVEGLIRELVF